MPEYLLVDSCSNNGFTLSLNESASPGLTKFRGKFQEAETINKNKRMYPFNVLDENVKKLNEVIEARGLIGECDHAADSIIHFEKASHLITKLWWEGKSLMGEGEILNTPHGKILKTLLDANVRVGISSRGVGNGRTTDEGVLVIGESYKLITFDAVADPSTFAAFQEKVVGSKEQYEIPNPAKNSDYVAKTETSRIHKEVNKEALIACLAGLIKEQTSNLSKRI